MTVTVLLFAAARDMAGAESVAVDLLEGATVAELRTTLARQIPTLARLLSRSAIAVNHDFAEETHVLDPTDELAVIPPVSGG